MKNTNEPTAFQYWNIFLYTWNKTGKHLFKMKRSIKYL